MALTPTNGSAPTGQLSSGLPGPRVLNTSPVGASPLAPAQEIDFFRLTEQRWEACSSFERTVQRRFLDDMKFAFGDSDNNWQWDKDVVNQRSATDRPFLTINKTRQHNLQITNDAKQNTPNIKVRPSGASGSVQAAEAYAGIVRMIEYQSNAKAVYDRAMQFQVNGGWGYWRVITEYCHERSFDQDIKIKAIANPLAVYIDPDAVEPDKSDMNYAFLFEAMSEDNARAKYPNWNPQMPAGQGGLILNPTTPFIRGKEVIIAEHYRRVWTQDTLMMAGDGNVVYASEISPESVSLLLENGAKTRSALRPTVEWYLICGRNVLEFRTIPGKFIPVVQVCAEELRLDGELDRKSHTRALKDPQRMYNYWASSAVEYGALQTKAPWKGPAEAFEGHEEIWAKANTENAAFLPYNNYDESGNKLDAPARVEPPVSAPLCMDGMRISQAEMSFVSGQYDNSMGQQGNERTGKAIFARQRKGDTATFHYTEALAQAIQYTGRLIVDMIPAIYDTARMLMIVGVDGKEQELKINPQMQVPYQETGKNQLGVPQGAQLNPKIGNYLVQSDTGPGYATQRQEAFEAFSLILTQNPAIAQVIGDIMLRAGDFPGSEEAADRLKRMVPPEALGTGPTPKEKELMQQVGTMQGTIQALMDQLVTTMAKLERQAAKTKVDQYGAFTNRLKVILDSEKSAEEMKMEVVKLMTSIMSQSAEVEEVDEPGEAGEEGPAPTTPSRPLGKDGGMRGQRFMSGEA